MPTQDYSPKIRIALGLSCTLIGVYALLAIALQLLLWRSDIAPSLAWASTMVVWALFWRLWSTMRRRYRGELVYNGEHWFRSDPVSDPQLKPVTELLKPHSAYLLGASLVVLRFQGTLLGGPTSYLLTRRQIGPDSMRRLRVLVRAHHFR